MKRKTNLFYTGNGIDESNFLTFSNYTEHLTGVLLATEFKIFPSGFICLYIPNLDKNDFIKNELVAYYENKLAFLRDEIEDPDNQLNYLGYLIDAILEYNDKSEIKLISKITEQDYNGTFTDIICTIDSSKQYYQYKIERDKLDGFVEASNKNYLYGWEDNRPQSYDNIKPKYDKLNDEDNGYAIKSKSTLIKEEKVQNFNESLIFNVIIPLYDITDRNIDTNNTLIDHNISSINLRETSKDGKYSQYVPYGIWFANEDIELKRANFKNYAPSWSLLIGTQFKPFPNSHFLESDENTNSSMGGFSTFAQIMCKQMDIYDSLIEYKTDIENKINNQLSDKDYEKKIKYLEETIDNLKERLEKLEDNKLSNNTHKWIVK